MRRTWQFLGVALVPAALPLACGSLNSGEVIIVDENAGAPASGGTAGSVGGAAGKGSGTAGSTLSGGRGGASGGTGATSGDAGEAGTGPSGGAGSANGGSTNGGSANGGSTNGGSANGGTGNVPTECTESTDCATALPICESGACRACTTSTECAARAPSAALCYKTTGECVECLKSTDCSGSLPVCDDHACRKCEEGSECASGACNSGRCADESMVVYALAGTGSYDTDCGTKDKPCISLSQAAGQLTSSRPFLVMIATQLDFNDNVTFPPMLDVTVFGNHVKVSAYNYSPPEAAFTINGGTVTLDDVVIEQSGESMGGNQTAGVLCTGGTLKARRLSVTNNDTSYAAAGVRLVDCNADIQESEFTGNVRGVTSATTAPGALTTSIIVERSLFRSNKEALQFEGGHFLIRNNLFLGNGQTSYVRIVRPIGLDATTPSYFVYNTLYGNDNNCSYEGGLIACEGGAAACGTLSSNITWNNMYNGASGTPCPDQVYTNAPTITYSIAETTWPGTHNSSSNPLFTAPDMDDFTLQAASPAIDQGNPDAAFAPSVDYYGNPRPAGDAPDIGAVEAPAAEP
jgi:hypothetical protein